MTGRPVVSAPTDAADWLDLLDRAAACYRQGLKEILEDCGHDKPDVNKIRRHAERAISGADYWLARREARDDTGRPSVGART